MIQFGNDKIKEIYVGSDKIKEVYHGADLVWSGWDVLTLFKSNRVNAGFMYYRRTGATGGTSYYIGDDKIGLYYINPSLQISIVVGLSDPIDVTQFSHLLLEYIVTIPASVVGHKASVISGITNGFTASHSRYYNTKQYIGDAATPNIYGSMMIDMSNFETRLGTVYNNCYVYVQLQPESGWKSDSMVALEVTKIELLDKK